MRSILERLRIESDVRFRIDELYREAGIVIAFPQRDVHLDSVSPVEVRIVERAEQPNAVKRHPPIGARPGTLAIPDGSPAPQIHLFHYGAGGSRRALDRRPDRAWQIRPGRYDHVDRRAGIGDEDALRELARCSASIRSRSEDAVNFRSLPRRNSTTSTSSSSRAHRRWQTTVDLSAPQVCLLVGPRFWSPSRTGTPASSTLCVSVFGLASGQSGARVPTTSPMRCGRPRRPLLPGGGRPLRARSTNSKKWYSRTRTRGCSPASTGCAETSQHCAASAGRSGRHSEHARARTSPFVSDEARNYLRDTHDHISQIMSRIDFAREVVVGLSTCVSRT